MRVSPGLIRTLVVVVAVLMWAFTIPMFFRADLAYTLGRDFVHFYTLGWIALHRATHLLYDPSALQATQAALVPALAEAIYPPLYPPQTPLFFAPLALMPYRLASDVWMIVTVVVYSGVVVITWRQVRREVADTALVIAGAVAFPPFWYLVLFRQNSVLVLSVFCAGWLALEHGRRLLAGLIFGFLALKPQFGVPFAVVVACRREWKLLYGSAASVALQAIAVMVVFGNGAFADFLNYLPNLVASANQVEPVLYKSLSLRTLSRLLPTPAGLVLWVVALIVVLTATVRAWRPDVPLRVRLAVVILSAVLVNPHMFVYDGVVLVLPLLWLAEWRARDLHRASFAVQAGMLCVAIWSLMPISLALGVAAGTIVTGVAVFLNVTIFATTVRDATRRSGDAVAV